MATATADAPNAVDRQIVVAIEGMPLFHPPEYLARQLRDCIERGLEAMKGGHDEQDNG